MKGLLLLIFSFITITSCDNQDPINSRIPFRTVNFGVFVNSATNKELWADGGYKIFPNEGYKGVIVYRVSSGVYRAYEMACTYQPEELCEKVEVDASGLFLIDKCCKSTFDFNGNVTGGPAPEKLLEYSAILGEDNYLTIINL